MLNRNILMDVAECAIGGMLFQTCGAAELKAHDAISVLVLGSASMSFLYYLSATH